MAGQGGTLTDWINAANPFRRAESEGEAVRAARIGAVVLALLAALIVVTLPLKLAMMHRMFAAMPSILAADPRTANADPARMQAVLQQMAAVLPPVIAVVLLVLAAVYVLLAVVQWKKPNAIIPAIFLAFAAYGVLSLLLNVLARPAMRTMLTALPLPPWYWAYSIAVLILQIVLLAASFRGALRLGRLRAG